MNERAKIRRQPGLRVYSARIQKSTLLYGTLLATLGLWLSACAATPATRRPDVLLITIDTLRADHLGSYGYAPAKTPVLDGLAQRGLRFQNAFTSVPVTLPSHATLLTGRFPWQHGVRNNSFYQLPAEEVTLAEVLKEQGYRTAAIVAAAALDHRFGLDQGFDLYDDKVDAENKQVLIAERPAEKVSSRAIQWLAGIEPSQNFFLWLHYFDPHDPYRPPPPFSEEFADRPYDGEIAYVDQQLGRVFDRLKASGRLEQTLVILTADHGESLGEHGEETHGIFLYDSTLRVPLILAGPGIAAGVDERGDPAGLVDVAPTIAARLGLRIPPGVSGLNLLDRAKTRTHLYVETWLPRDFYNWSELRGLRSASAKFVEAPIPELYDLSADPRELVNLAEREPRRIADLEKQLRDTVPQDSAQKQTQQSVDPELLERLKSLGYAGVAPAGRAETSNRTARPDPKRMLDLVTEIDDVLAQIRTGRLEEARSGLASILSRDPTNFLAMHTLSDVLFDLGRNREAVAAYQKTLQLGRETAYYHYRLALLRERLGEYAQAAREFQQVVLRNRDAAREVLERADKLLEQKQMAGAAAYLEMLHEAGAGGAALSLRLASVALAQDKASEALKILNGALSAEPQSRELVAAKIQALKILATQRGEKGDLKGAAQAFEQVLELDASDFETLANLGLTHLRAGRPEQALPFFERALAGQPGSTRILNLAAQIHYRLREYTQARDLLERSLSLDANQPEVKRALRQLKDKAGG